MIIKRHGCHFFQIQISKDVITKLWQGDWYNLLYAARDMATQNNMKATTRAE